MVKKALVNDLGGKVLHYAEATKTSKGIEVRHSVEVRPCVIGNLTEREAVRLMNEIGALVAGAKVKKIEMLSGESNVRKLCHGTVDGFIAGRCVTLDSSTVTAGHLYDEYKQWCHENGVRPLSKCFFGGVMRDYGYKQIKVSTRRVRCWVGICLREQGFGLPKHFYCRRATKPAKGV